MPPKFYEHVKQARRLPSDTTNKANIQKTLNDIANGRTNLHHLHSNFEGKPQNFLDNNYLSVLDLQVSMDSSTHDSFTPDNSFILYTTPDITNNDTSNNFYNAVTYESIDVSNTPLVINKLFLRTNPVHDRSNNLRILVNRILYLSLDNDSGYLIKRSDDVTKKTITLFKSGYDQGGKLTNKKLCVIPSLESISFENLSIRSNFNNLFPATYDLSDIYTHLGVGKHNVLEQDTIGSLNQTTSYLNSYGQKVILPNRGVESMPIKDDNMRRLIHMDTPNPFAKNLLYTVFDASNAINDVDTSSNPNIDFNIRNWLVSEEDLAPPRGNQVGQFVFTDDAKGEMAYQYFYDRDLSDITIGKKMPYTVFFNISGGKLEFSEQEYQKLAFPNADIDISSIATAADISNSNFFDLSGLNLDDNQMPSDFSTNFLVFKESYEYKYLAEIAATYFKSNDKFYYKVDGTEPDLSFHYVEWKDNNLNYDSVDQDNSSVMLSIIPTHGFFFGQTNNYDNSDFKSVLDRFYRHANRMIFANPPDLSSTLYFAYPDYVVEDLNSKTTVPTYIAVTRAISSENFDTNDFIRTLVGIDLTETNFLNIRSIIVGKDRILGSQLNDNSDRTLVDNGTLQYVNIQKLQNLESLNLRHLTTIDFYCHSDSGEDISHISTLVIPRTVTLIVNHNLGLFTNNIKVNNFIFLNDVSRNTDINISNILNDISGRVNTVYFLHPNVNSQTPNIVNDEQGNEIDTGNMKRLFSIPYNNNILKYE